MIPAVLGLTAWIAKGVVLTALPRLLKAVTERCLPTPKTSPTPPVRLNQAVPQTRNRAIVYDYDNLSQLVGVNINQTPAASFRFDDAGNLLELTTGNTTTNFGYNQLNQRTTPGTNVYDPKGQTTDQNGRQFEWDDDGRMTAIVQGTHRSEFQYDGYGRRVRITEKENAVVESDKLYWWQGGAIVCERDAMQAGNPITKRYFGKGVIVGVEKFYYTFDQLGSVRELVDSSGAVRADYRYSTYGERTKVGGDLESDWGYGGLWHHGPSGLDLATYRVYDSTQGRWISRDPLGEGVDYNLYRYCGNNPISCVDPLGLKGGLLTPIDRTLDENGNPVFTQRPNYKGLRVPKECWHTEPIPDPPSQPERKSQPKPPQPKPPEPSPPGSFPDPTGQYQYESPEDYHRRKHEKLQFDERLEKTKDFNDFFRDPSKWWKRRFEESAGGL